MPETQARPSGVWESHWTRHGPTGTSPTSHLGLSASSLTFGGALPCCSLRSSQESGAPELHGSWPPHRLLPLQTASSGAKWRLQATGNFQDWPPLTTLAQLAELQEFGGGGDRTGPGLPVLPGPREGGDRGRLPLFLWDEPWSGVTLSANEIS